MDEKLDFRIDGVITRIDSLGKEVAHIREMINVEKPPPFSKPAFSSIRIVASFMDRPPAA